jgi:uncharacterized protein (TIGR03435 family)
VKITRLARGLPSGSVLEFANAQLLELRLYDLQLDVGMVRGKSEGGRGADGAAPAAVIPDSGPTIFTALEQIGLKLESRKMPFPVMVVDQVEPPSAN